MNITIHFHWQLNKNRRRIIRLRHWRSLEIERLVCRGSEQTGDDGEEGLHFKNKHYKIFQCKQLATNNHPLRQTLYWEKKQNINHVIESAHASKSQRQQSLVVFSMWVNSTNNISRLQRKATSSKPINGLLVIWTWQGHRLAVRKHECRGFEPWPFHNLPTANSGSLKTETKAEEMRKI